MHLNLSAVLALAPPAQPGQPAPNPVMTVVPLILLFVIFYFILIRPQQKKAKEQAALVKSVKNGDKIITTSGIIATVITVKDDSVTIRSADAKMEITKGAIGEIRERSSESSASSS